MKNLLKVFAVLFLLSTAANADDKVVQIKEFINNVGDKIIKTAADNSLSDAKKREKIIITIDEVVDAQWIARFVLAKQYKGFNEEQKQKFSALYRQFMINTYGPKFKNYNGRKFEVIEVVQQNSFYVAKAEFTPKDGKAINVDFRVKEKEKKLVIIDFVAEGISLIETQRSEFNSAISQNGIEKFLQDFQVRVESLKAANK